AEMVAQLSVAMLILARCRSWQPLVAKDAWLIHRYSMRKQFLMQLRVAIDHAAGYVSSQPLVAMYGSWRGDAVMLRGAPIRGRSLRARRVERGGRLGAILLTSAVLAGCRARAGAQEQAPIARIHVDTVEVREQPMPRSLALTGTLKGQRHTDLAANAMGRVLE